MAQEEQKESFEIGNVKPVPITEEVQSSYLDYAMSVIVSRALPDVRDGLKPVQRRILYAMGELGLFHNTKFRKSATVVGEVLGKYHPHGDVAVYDSMVNLVQDFKMRYPLIDGQGNFGSMDGDAAAAMRYTEVRLKAISAEILRDIEKNTVDFRDNYDGTRQEPVVLPTRLPNFLLNGTLGIAVGMATNVPPHNLGEIVDGLVLLIDNPEATVEDLLKVIKGPDFPTGGEIYNIEEIKEAYATGKGRVLMRAVARIEESKKGFHIIITELPFQVNKAVLVSQIADLIKDKKIEGIADLRDESNKEGIRIVLDLKKDAYPNKILNQLYKYTPMQSAFHISMLALVDGIEPRVLTLKMVLEYFIKFRQEVVRRRSEYELEQAKIRAHILEGLKIALDNLDSVIKTIKSSADKNEAKVKLMKKFKLTEIQANAILEMKLSQLAALERQKIEDEYKEKIALIKWLKDLLASPKKILEVIKEELLEIKEKYADERRTKVIYGRVGEFSDEDLIPNEQVAITITLGNYIKRLPISTYRSQKRGGKGIIGMTTKEEDEIKSLVTAFNHDDILFFTNRGRCFQLKVYEVPQVSRLSRGQALVNFLQLQPGEVVNSIITLSKGANYKNLLMVTKNGMVKKTPISDFANIRRSGLIAIKIKPGDELKWVASTTGADEVIIATKKGQAIHFKETDVRPMGRASQGVRGIRLKKDDVVVGMGVFNPQELEEIKIALKEQKRRVKPFKDVLVVMENGYGKRTPLDQYHLQRRGGVGIKTAKITKKTGEIVGMEIVMPTTNELMAISTQGQVIKTPIKAISQIGRDTQGVRIMRLNENDKVASISILREEPEIAERESVGGGQEASRGGEVEKIKKPEIKEKKTKESKTDIEDKKAKKGYVEARTKGKEIKKASKKIVQEKTESKKKQVIVKKEKLIKKKKEAISLKKVSQATKFKKPTRKSIKVVSLSSKTAQSRIGKIIKKQIQRKPENNKSKAKKAAKTVKKTVPTQAQNKKASFIKKPLNSNSRKLAQKSTSLLEAKKVSGRILAPSDKAKKIIKKNLWGRI